MKYAVALAAAALTLGLSAPAAAATYMFSLTGDYTADWQLDSNPTPNNSNDFFFVLEDVSGNFPGLTDNKADLYFYTDDPAVGGGFQIVGSDPFSIPTDTTGPQLFTGLPSAPMFKTGTFILGSNPAGGRFQLVISEVGAAVPEPATWAMMIAGFGAVGGAMRRRTQVRVAYAA